MNIFDLPVHKAADIPPMLDDEKLQLLSESIKSDGLQQPIVIAEVDGVWMLIDGRNRRLACKIAGVEPAVRKLNGVDPMVTIRTSNNRRDGTAGQKAAQALLQENEVMDIFKLKKSGEISALAAAHGCPLPRFSQGLLIGEYKFHLLSKIVHEAYPFSKAYKEAQEEKRNLEQGTDGMKWLKKHAPELAIKAAAEADVEGGNSVDDYIAIAQARIEKEQSENTNHVTSVMHGLKSATNGLTAFEKGDALDKAMKLATEHNYCREEMDRYFTESELYALKNKASAITAGAKQITTFLKGL